MIAARFIDVNVLEPVLFHATYTGIALAQRDDAPPVVVWGRARPHVSLGQSQDAAAELAPDVGVPVVRRPLGGGTVWVDERQHCYVLVVPLSRAPRRPADCFEWGLRPAVATYRGFGLAVERVEQDLWLAGRKIAGSGAATIGACAVFASSFLIRFPALRFARCVRAYSAPYRAWLTEGLAATMTDWESHQTPPGRARLRRAFCAAVESELGWRLYPSTMGAHEHAMCAEVLEDPPELDVELKRRLVPEGIKLNARSFLTERWCGHRVERKLTVAGKIVRHERAPMRRT